MGYGHWYDNSMRMKGGDSYVDLVLASEEMDGCGMWDVGCGMTDDH